MNNENIPKKILHWYDNNKRILPWRKHVSKKQKQYFTLVSEFMLQQTQVKTVIPYFENFITKIPDLNQLAKVNDRKLMKCWEGLGYYLRARNLKKTAKKVVSDFNGILPNNIDDLKKLPGIGEYTSGAILAISFNKPIIPMDGNVERVLKRIFYLKKEKEITKENLNKKKIFFGSSGRPSDYAQAIMEIGALICKPSNPQCFECPISSNCFSFKKNDFEIKSKNKFNKIKYFEAEIYQDNKKYLLIKNDKFKFLKNLLIFPMKEITQSDSLLKSSKKLNVKMSNMNMNISIDFSYIKNKPKNGMWIEKTKLENYMIPTFTKKIFASVKHNI